MKFKKPDIKITTSVSADEELKTLVKEIIANKGEKTIIGNSADVIKDYMLKNRVPYEKETD